MGNFAIDLPDADVLIQVSGAFGSRQEEAQRLGSILRPKADGGGAHFFTLVSRDTREEEFAHRIGSFGRSGFLHRIRCNLDPIRLGLRGTDFNQERMHVV